MTCTAGLIQKNLRLRSSPQYLVGKVVWPVGRIGDAVTIEIERRIASFNNCRGHS